MKFSLSSSPFSGLRADDTLVILGGEDSLAQDPSFLELDRAHDGTIAVSMKREGFKPTWGKYQIFRPGTPGPGLLIIIGIDKSLLPIPLLIKQAGGAALERARSMGSTAPIISWIGDLPGDLSRKAITGFLAEGILLAEHTPFTLKKQEEESERSVNEVVLSWPGQETLVLEPSIERAKLISRGVNVARDLVNEPAMTMNPSTLAERVSGYAGDGLEVTVHDSEWLREKEMNGILGVGAGSAIKPCLIEVCYDPPKSEQSGDGELLLVGKGVTFDSGGLSLKPGESMKTMKSDMAGAAALTGIVSVLRDLSPSRPIRILIPAAENMPGGAALKLGDVLKIYGGKTVEVLNTDAEGRLVMADALAYGTEYEPAAAMDVATLTGASVVALGKSYAAVMGTAEDLVLDVLSSADKAGETIWRLPLVPHYKKQLESKTADLKNVGQRWGGAITAGLFLSEFVGDIPWAHIDIAGPAWIDKSEPAFPEGGTGFGVATIAELISPASS